MKDEEKVESDREEDVAVEQKQKQKVAKFADGDQKKQMTADLTEDEKKKEEDARKKAKEDEAKKKKEEEEEKGEDSERSKMAKILKDSQKVKVKLTCANSIATQILLQIEGDAAYKWAKDNVKGDAKIKTAVQDVKDVLSEFHREYVISSNFQDLKKKYAKETIVVELTALARLDSKVSDLQRVCESFYKASEAMREL